MPLDSLILANAAKEISETFHIHGWTFFCQLVNFLIVCFALKKFAYGPVMNILEQRRKRIADGEERRRKILRRGGAKQIQNARRDAS